MHKIVLDMAGLVELVPVMMGFGLDGSVVVVGRNDEGRVLNARFDAEGLSRDLCAGVFMTLVDAGMVTFTVIAYVEDRDDALVVREIVSTVVPYETVTVWAGSTEWEQLDGSGTGGRRDPAHPAVVEYRVMVPTRPMAASRSAHVADMVEPQTHGEELLTGEEVQTVTVDRTPAATAAWIADHADRALTRGEKLFLLAQLQDGACRDEVYRAVVQMGPTVVADMITQVVTATADDAIAVQALAVQSVVCYLASDSVVAREAISRAQRIGSEAEAPMIGLMCRVVDAAIAPDQLMAMLEASTS